MGADFSPVTLLNQIGRMNVLAISGGRIARTGPTTISLPVRYGYSVEIEYHEVPDTYTVRRIFARGSKRWVKTETTQVHCDQVGEVAYRASCYLDD